MLYGRASHATTNCDFDDSRHGPHALHEPRRGEPVARVSWDRLLTFLMEAFPERSAGLAYEAARQQLVTYFTRRDAIHCGELADETLDRLAHSLRAQPTLEIRHPMRYMFGVARITWLGRVRSE